MPNGPDWKAAFFFRLSVAADSQFTAAIRRQAAAD